MARAAITNEGRVICQYTGGTTTRDDENHCQVAVWSRSSGTANWYIAGTQQLTTCLKLQSRGNPMTEQYISVSESIPQSVLGITTFITLATPWLRLGITTRQVKQQLGVQCWTETEGAILQSPAVARVIELNATCTWHICRLHHPF